MKKISDIVYKKYGSYPERILQFGDGNFLRAFCDFIIEKANEKNILNSSIVISQNTRGGKAKELNNQNGIYTLIVRGKENGEIIENIEQITSVSRCLNPYIEYDKLLEIFKSEDLNLIISNTTEAGIVYDDSNNFEDIPPSSYPARLTRGLYERFKSIGNKEESKLLILPLELTNENGTNLKNIILQYTKLWKLDLEFINGDFIGERENNEKYKIMDSEENIKFFSSLNSEWNNGNLESLTHKIMSKIELWNGINFTKIKYLEENVFKNLEKIEKYKDIKKVLSELLN